MTPHCLRHTATHLYCKLLKAIDILLSKTSLLTWCITNIQCTCMHQITNLELIWLSKLRENNGRKNTLVAQGVCFQMLDFKTSRVQSQLSSNILLRYYFFLKNYNQREPFLTMFYTVNSSPLLVTKLVFMLTIVLSNYQCVQCL